jgi:anti-sigma B factor antagonist
MGNQIAVEQSKKRKNSMLEISVENQPEGRVKVSLKGRLDSQTYAECEKRLEPLLKPPTKVLVFDLAQLDFISSMGLRVLMKTTKTLSGVGAKCLLTNLQPPIQAVVNIAKALPPQNIFASVEEADRYLAVMQRRVRETGSSTASE